MGRDNNVIPAFFYNLILISTLVVYEVLAKYNVYVDVQKHYFVCPHHLQVKLIPHSYAAGVYSIVMDVADVADNKARARTVFFLDPLNNIEISDNREVIVQQGVASDTGIWIADTGQLDIEWTGVFANLQHVRNNYMKPVEQIYNTLDDTRADDGNRTLAAVANSDGMTHFEVFWTTGSSQTVVRLSPPQSTRLRLNPQRADGNVVSLTVQGYDLSGHFKVGRRQHSTALTL